MVMIDMEMPERCMECPLCCAMNFGAICTVVRTVMPDRELFDGNGMKKKPDWCPLIEVPERRQKQLGVLDEEVWD